MEFKEICGQFAIDGTFLEAVPYGEGHINETYLVTTDCKQYILQKINDKVFQKPEEVMENIVAVTTHIRRKIQERGGDVSRETLNVIPTKNQAAYLKNADGYYRMYDFIDGATSYQSAQRPILFYNAARAFGTFQRLLADFPAGQLHETIIDFHNTRERVRQLKEAVRLDKANRCGQCGDEIAFALQRADGAGVLMDALDSGELPLRVTHNDTKLNNVMIDNVTDEGICVIDLDTVMPGSMLFDYGDSIRFGASSGAEDEKDLSKIYMDMELFTQYTKGFLSAVGDSITPGELRYMALSAKILTYECGIRFLADYLNGDTYFRTHYPEHNLDRCRTQFKLVADMEQKMDQMNQIVETCSHE